MPRRVFVAPYGAINAGGGDRTLDFRFSRPTLFPTELRPPEVTRRPAARRFADRQLAGLLFYSCYALYQDILIWATFSLVKSGYPDIIVWKFYDFLDSRGNNEIRDWLDGLPEKASAKIDVRILFMQSMAVWPEQYVSAIEGWPEMLELRVVSAGSQYRPIGFYGPNRREFTLVLGAIEKGKIPRRVFKLADNNRKMVLADERRICRHVFAKSATNTKPSDGH